MGGAMRDVAANGFGGGWLAAGISGGCGARGWGAAPGWMPGGFNALLCIIGGRFCVVTPGA